MRQVTPLEAFRQATRDCASEIRAQIEPPGVDVWQTPKETEAYRYGDCEDMAGWTVWRTAEILRWTAALASDANLQLVVGQQIGQEEHGKHAWAQLLWNGQRYWADATPDYRLVEDASFFAGDRVPEYGYRWDHARQAFVEKFRFELVGP